MPANTDVSPLGAHLGYWLRYVSNQVSHAFARKMMAQGVSVAEWVFLRVLHDAEALAPSEIAERMGMTRGGITKLADKLLRKGLVTRRAESIDRRYQALALAPAGRKLVPVLARLADANDAEFFGHLSRAERTALATAMKDIVRRHGLKALPVD